MKEEEKKLLEELSQGEKICPLRSLGAIEPGYCFGEVCAFWDKENKRCAIISIAQTQEVIKKLVVIIDEILANMHEVLANLNELLRELTEEDYYV